MKPSPLVILFSLLFLAGPAWAQTTRTWVSGVGDDASPCSRTAPCKTFAGAISKTAAGGEISVLDPGGFGAVTITKAITIDGGSSIAGVLAAGVNGIVVAAGANDVVILRRLSIAGFGTGQAGVKFNSGKALHVEDSHIWGFSQEGILFAPAVASKLFVRNTIVSTSAGQANVFVGGASSAVFEKCSLVDGAGGLKADGTASVTLHDTIVANNAGIGIHAAGNSQVNVERGVVAHNGTGAQGDGKVVLSEVMVSGNNVGVTGTVVSFGNNRIAAGNETDGAPSSTLPQQ